MATWAHVGLRRRITPIRGIWPALFLIVTVAYAAGAAAQGTTSATVPRRDDIRNTAATVGNHYRTAKPCSAGSCAITNKWDDAVLMMGMIEHWRKFGTAAYRTYAENWARKNAWNLFTNTSGSDQRNPNWHNRMTAGYTYLRLLQAGTAGATVANVRTNLDDQLALQLAPERQQLVDHVFPGRRQALLLLEGGGRRVHGAAGMDHDGQARRQRRLLPPRRATCRTTRSRSWGSRTPRASSGTATKPPRRKRSPDGKPIVWGRGTGWIAGALALALSELPASRAGIRHLPDALRRSHGRGQDAAAPRRVLEHERGRRQPLPGAGDQRDRAHHLRDRQGHRSRDPERRHLPAGRGEGLERDGGHGDPERRLSRLLPEHRAGAGAADRRRATPTRT